jgi:hypothetical protein
MPARRVKNLPPTDAAYLAGLIDGEGTITRSRRHAKDKRQLVVSISSTERVILDWVLAAIGAGKITRKRVTSIKHAPGLTYAVSNRQALALLAQTAYYLRSYKRLRAQLNLDRYLELAPRDGKYSTERAAEREAFEDAVLGLTAGGEIHAKQIEGAACDDGGPHQRS